MNGIKLTFLIYLKVEVVFVFDIEFFYYWILSFSSISVSVVNIRSHESLYLESILQWDIRVIRMP